MIIFITESSCSFLPKRYAMAAGRMQACKAVTVERKDWYE
jgi:hypothetical protein